MKNRAIKLSIVIPVYKTEMFLEKCLHSILDQEVDRSVYEVIVVNDGSPDNSQAIIDDFCNKYDNVSCIVQENQGLSMARNNGAAKSKGEYIWYIDSDDWVKYNSICSIIAECDYQPDVISITSFKEQTTNEYQAPYSTSGHEILQSEHFEHGMVYYILRKEFVSSHNLYIYPGIYHEDSEFTPRMLYYANKIRVIPEPLYHIYANPASITRSVNSKKSYDIIISIRTRLKFRDEVVAEPKLKKVFDDLLSVSINNSIANIILCDHKTQLEFDKALYKDRYIFKALKRSSRLKNRIEWILFIIFPKHYTRIYKLLLSFKKLIKKV